MACSGKKVPYSEAVKMGVENLPIGCSGLHILNKSLTAGDAMLYSSFLFAYCHPSYFTSVIVIKCLHSTHIETGSENLYKLRWHIRTG